ncbi:hypothetical protein JTF08_17940, partial [Micrococcaceae bacterium RIT802]|nr:hypothetical protein [Micrococcaceae bacterium RIT 802]
MNAVLSPVPTTTAPAAGSGGKASTMHDGGASFGAALAEQLGTTAPGAGQPGIADQSAARPGTTEASANALPGPSVDAAPVAPTLVAPGQIPLPVQATPPGTSDVVPDAANADGAETVEAVVVTKDPASDPATTGATGKTDAAPAEPGAAEAPVTVPGSTGSEVSVAPSVRQDPGAAEAGIPATGPSGGQDPAAPVDAAAQQGQQLTTTPGAPIAVPVTSGPLPAVSAAPVTGTPATPVTVVPSGATTAAPAATPIAAAGTAVPASPTATSATPDTPTSTPAPTASVQPTGGLSMPSTPALQPVHAAAASAPAAAPQQPEPLNRQLAGPIATLATGPHGDRTMTVNVAPDGLGPVTVKAHLGVEGLRVELVAPTDAGRDALRTLLGDLRRDLAVLGHGSVSLATPDGPDSGPGAGSGQQQGSAGQHSGSRPATHQSTGTGVREP